MKWYFEKNRASFEKKAPSTVDWSRAHYGEVCFLGLNDVIVCHAAGEHALAQFWLDDARSLIQQSEVQTKDDVSLDLVGLDRVYVAIASRLEGLLRGGVIERSQVIPYDAFEAYLSADASPEDFECVWLMWGLCASLEDQRTQYEALMTTVHRKPHRDLVKERELLTGLGVLFGEAPDEMFWNRYRQVLLRWLNPALETEGEASLYRDPIRFLLAMNWMVFKLHTGRREEFLEVIFGNL